MGRIQRREGDWGQFEFTQNNNKVLRIEISFTRLVVSFTGLAPLTKEGGLVSVQPIY